MGVVPQKPIERVQWYENRIDPWTSNTVAIGLVSADVTDITAKTSAARAAYDAQQVALDAAKNATQAFYDAVAAMSAAGSAAIKKIRAKAAMTGNSVYTLAVLPPPPTPAPRPAPGTPSNLKVELNGDGSLLLKWKCPNPPGAAGTIYQIFRRVGTAGTDFTYLGGTGQRSFQDTTVPGGATCLTYQLQAARSTAVGNFAQFIVNFGTNSGGGTTVQSVEATPPGTPKLAA
jgi:hypothetical protein